MYKENVFYCIILYSVWFRYRSCDGGFVGLWCIWACNCPVRLLEWCAMDKCTLIYYILDNSKSGTSHEVFMSSFFFFPCNWGMLWTYWWQSHLNWQLF
jgi:hypothetical protein